MDHQFADRLRHVLNNDVATRLLIRYFVSKGYDNFDTAIYPPMIQDLPMVIPEMADKIEITPHARTIDPIGDTAELGWNLFALGTQRMYLGETQHVGLRQLALQLQQGAVLTEDRSATRQTTPRRIVNFVSKVLLTHRGGYVNLTPRIVPVSSQRPYLGGPSMPQHFFARRGY